MMFEKTALEPLFLRAERLKNARAGHETLWRELARFCCPHHSLGRLTPGKKPVLDSTAALSADALASGLFALMTNPALDWFDFEDGQQREETRALTVALKATIEDRDNGLYGVLPDFFRDLVTFGTAVLWVEAAPGKQGRLRLEVRSLTELVFACNDAGIIDTAFREFNLSAEQCLQRFGQKAPAAATKAVANGQPDDDIPLVHAVVPNTRFKPGAIGQRGKRFHSLVLDPLARQCIHAGGYHELPFLVARWSVPSGSGHVYGQSPASLALADIRALNAMVRTNLTAAQMAVDPPLMTVDDNGLRGVKTFPGAVVFGGLDANGRKMVEPMPLGGVGAINLGLALEEQRRDSIRDAFHLGLLRDASVQANQTATEFLGRQEERLRLLAPNLGRIESELLSPLIRRVAGILNRAGVAPPMPNDVHIRFLSPLAQAQRAAEAHRLTRNVRALQPFAEMVPNALDQLDTQRLTKDLLSLAGLPRLGDLGS